MLSQLCLVNGQLWVHLSTGTHCTSLSYWIENVEMWICVWCPLCCRCYAFSLPYRLPDFNANASLIWTQRVQVLYSWSQTHAGLSVETIGNCFSRLFLFRSSSLSLSLTLTLSVSVFFLFFRWMQFRNFHYIFGWYWYWLGMLFCHFRVCDVWPLQAVQIYLKSTVWGVTSITSVWRDPKVYNNCAWLVFTIHDTSSNELATIVLNVHKATNPSNSFLY